MNEDEVITAFAYRTAKEIEAVIKLRLNDLAQDNKIMEGQILSFMKKIHDQQTKEAYMQHFGITSERTGKI